MGDRAVPTLCVNCDHATGRGKHPSHWMCLKFPRLEGFGFVTDDKWDSFPPYMYCNGINGGACPLFEERNDDVHATEHRR